MEVRSNKYCTLQATVSLASCMYFLSIATKLTLSSRKKCSLSQFNKLVKSMSLLSQRDSYQTESINEVISCTKDNSENYEVVLNDTVLYPEGGGQPWDLGQVDGIEVLKVLKCSGTNNHVKVTLLRPVTVGTHVRSVIDWKRRYDFMQQHTAQHLFSAVADKLYSADTVGWSLGDENVSVDFSLALSATQLSRLEVECNEFIRSGLAVSWKVLSRQDLDSADDEKMAIIRGAVKGAAMELQELRMVGIEGLDLNPCGGTHLRSLSEINLIKVIGTEKTKGGVRVRLVAGDRALSYFAECVKRDSVLTQKLSVPPTQYVSCVDKLLKERRDLTKKLDAYSEELASYFGATLGTKMLNEGISFVAAHRSGADLKFLVKAADSLLAVYPAALLFLSGDDLPPSSGVVAKSAQQAVAGPYVLFGGAEAVAAVKEAVQSAVSGRGGGRPGRLQGQATNLSDLAEVQRLLQNFILR